MKKAKLLTLLAVLTLLTVPAHAAGSCPTVRDNAQWKVFCSAPANWNCRISFVCPDFLCPNEATRPDATCPNGATCAPNPTRPDVSAPSVPDTPTPDAPTVPALPDVTETPEPAAPAVPQTDAGMSAYETEVVRLVNVERAKYGLSALAADGELSRGARVKSQDMRDKGYFSHESPTYGSPFQMMKSFGISYRTAGENIAYGYSTPEKVVQAWMNSEGHRANILNSSYTRLGVGYVADGHYWTQWFVG